MIYIDYLDASKNFKQTRKEFSTYEEAKKWALKNLEKFDEDMIKHE